MATRPPCHASEAGGDSQEDCQSGCESGFPLSRQTSDHQKHLTSRPQHQHCSKMAATPPVKSVKKYRRHKIAQFLTFCCQQQYFMCIYKQFMNISEKLSQLNTIQFGR